MVEDRRSSWERFCDGVSGTFVWCLVVAITSCVCCGLGIGSTAVNVRMNLSGWYLAVDLLALVSLSGLGPWMLVSEDLKAARFAAPIAGPIGFGIGVVVASYCGFGYFAWPF